ncbi:caspase domain-containing protein, partial [Flagelloscypha sp. PMI_526]
LFALVIGINDYQYTRKLSGCVADAQDIVSYLTKHLAVPMNHITTLFNEEANRTHILENLQAFAHDEFIAKNSPILIYYAGHGARAVAPKDWEVDERDRQIQMILPWDFNPQTSSAENEQGIPDITLRSILDNLAEKKGNNITVILDSSHSVSHSHGDGTDSYHATSRDVKLPETYTILPSIDAAICPGPRLEQVSLSHQNDRAASHVLLAACSSGETAKEENGRGRFTSALMQYLRDPKTLVDTTTYDQVVQALNIHGQTPRSEGFHSQQYLFNGMVRSAGCILHPIRRNRRGEFIMNAGEAHGINPGTVFSILPENDPSSLAVGEFVVTDTSLHFFYTVISTRISMPPIAWALQRYGGYQLSIKFQSSGEGIADEIISQLKTTCVQDSKKRFLLTFDDGHCELSVTSQNGSVVIEITDEQCRSAGLRYLPSLPLQCDKVYPVLNAAYQFFWHLRRKPNHEDVLPVELEAWQLRTARRAAQRMPIGDNLCREGVIRIPINSDGTSSAYFGYKIVNLSEEDLFVWMFSYNFLDLSIRLLHKPSISSGEPDPCLRSGGVLPVGYGSSGTGPRTFSLPDGQDIDVTYLKVFLSTKYIDLSSVVAASRFSERRTVRELDMGLLEGRWDTHCVLALQERRV